MNIPKLTELGFCEKCNKWLELAEGTSWLPAHNMSDGVTECSSSRYSPPGRGYVVKTEGEARQLADFLKNDDGKCLVTTHTEMRFHSLSCGDGRDCAELRLRLARALAEYYLMSEKTPVTA